MRLTPVNSVAIIAGEPGYAQERKYRKKRSSKCNQRNVAGRNFLPHARQ